MASEPMTKAENYVPSFKHDSTGVPISGINERLFHFISRVAWLSSDKENLVHSELTGKMLLTVVIFSLNLKTK
jgi:hypothetical protein